VEAADDDANTVVGVAPVEAMEVAAPAAAETPVARRRARSPRVAAAAVAAAAATPADGATGQGERTTRSCSAPSLRLT